MEALHPLAVAALDGITSATFAPGTLDAVREGLSAIRDVETLGRACDDLFRVAGVLEDHCGAPEAAAQLVAVVHGVIDDIHKGSVAGAEHLDTRRREAEARYRSFTDTPPDPIELPRPKSEGISVAEIVNRLERPKKL